MADYDWPVDLVPYQVAFYLQPHTGGSESPFSRVSKIYGLSAPRWVCSMSFRGGYWGEKGLEAVGPRLDAMIAKLRGRQNRVALYDFRRSKMRTEDWPQSAGNSSAALGATSMTLTGLIPGQRVRAGDYIGGDGRPHIILEDVSVAGDGTATITFEPPLSAAIGTDVATFGNATGLFRLANDDAGQNGTEVGQGINMTLEFVEDL
jgi:hypothetical protein